MKKSLLVFLSLILVLSLAACGSDQEGQPEVEEEDLTVGFIYVGPIGDGGYTYAHDQGRLYLEENMNVKTIYKESVPETQEVEQEIRNMIDQGAEAIFATSFGYMDYIEKVSKDYPDVAFFHCSGYKTTDNLATYFGRIYQPRYLSGIVAGLKTETNEIGYVAAYPIPEVIRGINAFALGAQSVNPDVKVSVKWTSTWYDPAIEKEAAIALIDEGADIIAQHQDTTGPQQAAEERGVYSIGYNTDMAEMAPEAYMTAPEWNWGPYYVEQTQNVIDGTFESHQYWGGMEENVVQLAPLTDLAPEEAKEEVEEAKEKILNEQVKVFGGPIYDQEGNLKVEEGQELTDGEMLGMMWFVEGIEGNIE